MRLIPCVLQAGVLLSAATSAIAASWTFTDASLSIHRKGSGVGEAAKEKLTPGSPLVKPIALSSTDSLKLILTTTEGKSAKKAHQAFLLLNSAETGLDISYPFSVKDNGKSKVDLSLKDIPASLLRNKQTLQASIVIGSFGSSEAYKSLAFTLQPNADGTISTSAKPLRYGKLPEIHHVFRSDPKSPPKIISLVFALATSTTIPLLLGAWLTLGGNINHLSKALSDAPISHAFFLGSIIGVEGVLFLYYTTWNLFQTLPVLTVLGIIALISGSRALTEVQQRRLTGLR